MEMAYKKDVNTVYFHFMHPCTLKNRNELKQFINSLFKKEKKKLQEIRYIFCSDEELLEINRQHLQHDYYTDIITFDLSTGPATIGEVYISTDRVKDNAQQFKTTFTQELHRVIFHGALHLCGYKDKKPADIKAMRAAEDKYLKAYFK